MLRVARDVPPFATRRGSVVCGLLVLFVAGCGASEGGGTKTESPGFLEACRSMCDAEADLVCTSYIDQGHPLDLFFPYSDCAGRCEYYWLSFSDAGAVECTNAFASLFECARKDLVCGPDGFYFEGCTPQIERSQDDCGGCAMTFETNPRCSGSVWYCSDDSATWTVTDPPTRSGCRALSPQRYCCEP